MVSVRSALAFAAIATISTAQSDAGVHFILNPIDVQTQDNVFPAFRMSFIISNPALQYFGGGSSANCILEWCANCILEWDGSAPTCQTHCQGTGSYFVQVTPGTTPTAQDFSIDLIQHFIYEIGNDNRATVEVATGNATAGYVCEQPAGPNDCCVLNGVGFDVPALTYYGVAGPAGDAVCPPGCTVQNPC